MLRVVLCAHGVLNTWNLSPQMLGMAAAVREQELVCSPLFDQIEEPWAEFRPPPLAAPHASVVGSRRLR